MKNIFLTGIPGAGKTTIIERMLAELRLERVAGFFTTRSITPELRTFWLNDRTTLETTLLACVEYTPFKKLNVNLEAFEPFALNAIAQPCDLLILDELGRFEEPCKTFKNAVHSALSGATPVLGVLKVTNTPFVRSVAERSDVRVITVTESTRDSAYAEFLSAVQTISF